MLRFIKNQLKSFRRSIAELGQWIVGVLNSETGPEGNGSPLWRRTLAFPFMIPIWIGMGLATMLKLPLLVVRMKPIQRSRFKLVVAITIGLSIATCVCVYFATKRDMSRERYAKLISEAAQRRDFELVCVLGKKCFDESLEPTQKMQFEYAMALMQIGKSEQAEKLLAVLAPDTKSGYAPAHLLRAAEIVQSRSQTAQYVKLKNLKWHLTNSGTELNEQRSALWGAYYQHVGQINEAINRFEQAARINPVHYIRIGELHRVAGNDTKRIHSLETAQKVYHQILAKNPSDAQSRIQLVVVMMSLEQFEIAEQLLSDGLEIERSPELEKMTARLSIAKYDYLRKTGESLEACFDCLEQSLRLDPNYSPAYDRLVQLYSIDQPKAGDDVLNLLKAMIADGKHVGIAHFALSNVALAGGDAKAAQQHLFKAAELSPRLPVVCNNLAWMLAHNTPAQLDEALQLAQEAVKAVPQSASFHDTLGTIYLKLGRHSEAVRELEQALIGNASSKTLHSRLAKAYYGIGETSLSRRHWEKGK